jgi:predicted nucleic acid-binding Zn ribbon protein
MSYRRTPRGLGQALEQARQQWSPGTLLADIQAAWPGVAGETLAGVARPSSVGRGVVTIDCSASLWAHELDLMGPQIVAGLNAALGGERVTRIRCVATDATGRR